MAHNSDNTADLILVCKLEFEQCLMEEILRRAGEDAPEIQPTGAGLLILNRRTGSALPAALASALVFERQRLENAALIPASGAKPMARSVVKQLLPPITASNGPWTCHAFAGDFRDATALSERARTFRRVMLEFCHDRFGPVYRRHIAPDKIGDGKGVMVLNLCFTPAGIWGAAMPSERLTDSHPGGLHRMAMDNEAPCRSYLKIEEAFDLMGEKPQPGETVIDLGASPGGWTHAFLKRGCRVTAVDNGPIRVADPRKRGGSLVHLREDGVAFEPDRRQLPVDWLVSDMLVSTGKNFGMLKKWFAGRWMRRFVVNIKLPQIHPYPALEPVEDYLRKAPGARFKLRQLYHDRREVTLFGELE